MMPMRPAQGDSTAKPSDCDSQWSASNTEREYEGRSLSCNPRPLGSVAQSQPHQRSRDSPQSEGALVTVADCPETAVGYPPGAVLGRCHAAFPSIDNTRPQ
jgi:hypothetical protein